MRKLFTILYNRENWGL